MPEKSDRFGEKLEWWRGCEELCKMERSRGERKVKRIDHGQVVSYKG